MLGISSGLPDTGSQVLEDFTTHCHFQGFFFAWLCLSGDGTQGPVYTRQALTTELSKPSQDIFNGLSSGFS